METNVRHLSVAEYFHVVQKEYLIAEFRKKIYYSPKDKAYYQRVMTHKAEKINKIAKRNRLNSILNNNDTLEKFRDELFDKLGKPKFELSETDVQNYYAIGNEFAYHGDVWILDQVKGNGSLTLYSPALQRYESVKKDDVCRIL